MIQRKMGIVELAYVHRRSKLLATIVVVVVVVYFILSRLVSLAYSANLGLLCMPHPGMAPLV